MRATLAACGFALAWSMAGAAPRPVTTATIDDQCKAIRNEFLEAAPKFFSGPDPWLELAQPPDSFVDMAVARIYYEGARIRWLVLQMQGPANAWFETSEYFFAEDGLVEKRTRRLEHYDSHIAVDEDLYLNARKVVKAHYRHTSLPGAAENWETFYDPDAPFYTAMTDLPSLFLKMEFGQLAGSNGPASGNSGWRQR